jgi:hypothetical protein
MLEQVLQHDVTKHGASLGKTADSSQHENAELAESGYE